jgi:hypothetical protein
MILLGTLAVGVMLAYPQGLWGIVADRWDLQFFPVGRRVRAGQAPLPPTLSPRGERVKHRGLPRLGAAFYSVSS